MADRNLYVILGVSRGESPAGIRAAFLDLAKKHHPDVSGVAETGPFQEIAEAYRVLSDPDLRRRHDERLLRLETWSGASVPTWAPEARSEPLRPDPVRIMSEPDAVYPSFAAAYDRLLRNFTGLGVPKAERVEPLGFDLVLTPHEAARGGILRIVVPVFVPCPSCRGSGRDWAFTCLWCDGQGVTESERTVGVGLPPMTPDGTVIEVPLEGLGIHNFRLRLHVRIGV